MSRRGDETTARLHREFLAQIVTRTGKQPTTIAKELDIAPSTLTRKIELRDGKVVLKNGRDTFQASTIARLEAYSGVPAPTGLDGGMVNPGDGRGSDATRYQLAAAPPALRAAIEALTAGRRNTELWQLRSRALECDGFRPGDVVVVDYGQSPRAGDFVCAEVHWPNADQVLMRVYEPPYLVASTFDVSLRKPLTVDNDHVIVRGLILPHRLRP
jgi:hypothetical protein